MLRKLSWLDRDDPSYDPNRIGAISQAKVMAALVEAGKAVLAPCVSVLPYDLAIDEGGHLNRVQCKTGRLVRGAIYFRSHRLRAAKRESGWQRRVRDYAGDIDSFGVFCPDNGGVYLVPIEALPGRRVCSLRLTPPKNNQRRRIRWAKDFEVLPLQTVRPQVDGALPWN
jgi:hypothetical protein